MLQRRKSWSWLTLPWPKYVNLYTETGNRNYTGKSAEKEHSRVIHTHSRVIQTHSRVIQTHSRVIHTYSRGIHIYSSVTPITFSMFVSRGLPSFNEILRKLTWSFITRLIFREWSDQAGNWHMSDSWVQNMLCYISIQLYVWYSSLWYSSLWLC